MIPFTHPAQKIDLVDSKNKDMEQSYMFQEKVIKNLLLLAVGVAKQFPKSNFWTGADLSLLQLCRSTPASTKSNRDHFFYEHGLILLVNQGLTLLTASLVPFDRQLSNMF